MKIAIAGVGPRGLLVTRQLVKNFQRSSVKGLQILLFDRYPVGGRVWRTTQYQELKMDTISQQITMFPLASKLPNLYQWIKRDSIDYVKKHHYKNAKLYIRLARKQSPNYYARRCMYGLYLQWFYDRLMKRLPQGVTIKKVNHFVYTLHPLSNGGYKVGTEDSEYYTADKVVLNLGQQVNKLSGPELRLGMYAHDNQLLYYPIGYVEEKNVNLIQPKQNLIVRGLGLNFMDTMNVLTIGRGGYYQAKKDGSLVYHPSGREPMIIAGSRRGLPYYCKAANQKTNGQHPQPYFLNHKVVKKHLHNGKLSYHEFFHLLELDMDLIYYDRLIRLKYPQDDAREFKHRFINTDDHRQVIKDYHFKPNEIFHLDNLLDPINYSHIHTIRHYEKAVVKWLSQVIHEALVGNVKSPLTAAISIIRDSRDAIRWIVNNDLFSADDYINKFLPRFNSLNSLLVMGPPVTDLNRLRALIRAKIAKIIPEGMVVKPGRNCFISYSKQFPHHKFKAQMMAEARNPIPRTSLSNAPLTKHLYQQGMITNPKYTLANHKQVTLDCVNVKSDTDQIIDRHGKVQPNLYTWGLSTEGIHWCTPNAPHCSGHDSNLRASARIAKDLLGIPHSKFNLM